MASLSEKIDRSPKVKKLVHYMAETRTIMAYLGYSFMTPNDEYVGECLTSLLQAEQAYKPELGKLSTIKFNYIKNRCANILRHQASHRLQILKKAEKLIVLDKYADRIRYKFDILRRPPEQEIKVDYDTIMDYINTNKSITDRQKKCFLMHCVEGYTYEEIGEKLGIHKNCAMEHSTKCLIK